MCGHRSATDSGGFCSVAKMSFKLNGIFALTLFCIAFGAFFCYNKSRSFRKDVSFMDQTMLLIVNPRAGLQRANHQLCNLIELFQAGGYRCTVLLTASRGDGIEYARRWSGDFDRIVCVGGDGTFNEVVAGVLASGHNTPIGYLPSGSTNDFAGSMGLSSNLTVAAQDVISGEIRPLDVGCFCGRPFTYVASFGAFTRASYATPQDLKNALGHLAYILSGIREVPNIRSEHLRVRSANFDLEGEFIFGAVCNSTSVGGLLKLDPSIVDMNDGLLELLLIRLPANAIELAQILVSLNQQKYDNCPCIVFDSTPRVEITAPPDMGWTLDGESEPGHAEIVIENQPHAIRFIVPPGTK